MKAAWFVLLFTLGLSAEETAIQKRGRAIVESALTALGGEAFLAINNRVEEGRLYSFHRERVSGAARAALYTQYLPHPNGVGAAFFGLRERQSFRDKKQKEERAILFNELEGFDLNYRGATPITKEIYDRYRNSTLRNIFYILRQRRNEKGMIFEFRETSTLDNLPVEVVDITDDENRVVKVFFQLSNHLPARQIYNRRDPETREVIEEISLFSKYRDVGGGVMWPFSMVRHRNGEKIFELFSESVKINQKMDDGLFTLPVGVKVLKTTR
jgi:hypothetical protein